MAKSQINIYRYGQLIEEYLAKGKSVEQAHKIASSSLMRKPDKFDKPSLVDKIILGKLKRSERKKKK